MDESGISMENKREDSPRDKYGYVYWALMVLGLGTVLPWNTFINTQSYFVNYKLNDTDTTDMSNYRQNYMSYIGLFAAAPNFLLQLGNIIFQSSGTVNLRRRISLSIGVEIAIIAITLLLAIMDTSSWPVGFFFLTVVLVVILNSAAGIYQNSAFGVPANLPQSYTNALVIGMNGNGTLLALALILSIAIASGSEKMTAIVYFTFTIVTLCAIIVMYQTLYKTPFFQYYNGKVANDGNVEQVAKSTKPEMSYRERFASYRIVFNQCAPQLFNIWLIFFVSLACFPILQIAVKPAGQIDIGAYFIPVGTLLNFNLFALIGNIFAGERFYQMKPSILWVPCTVRILFIPFFMLCNKFVHNDFIFFIAGSLLGYSSGYLSSLGMMYAPKSVEPEYMPIAGMMGGFSLITGIFTGILSTFLWSYIMTL